VTRAQPAHGQQNSSETLSLRWVGHLTAALWILCGLLVAFAGSLVSFPADASRFGVVGVGTAATMVGCFVWVLPWERWRRSATLCLVPPALGLIALFDHFTGNDGYIYPILYVVVFMWLGLAHPPGMSLRFSPMLAAAYLLPLLLGGSGSERLGLESAAYVLPVCLLVGETVAWVGGRLRSSESARTDAEERFRNAFENAPTGMVVSDLDGVILRANPAFAKILGRDARGLDGLGLRQVTCSEDWEESDIRLEALLRAEIDTYSTEKRFVHSDGHLVWVSVSASCTRDAKGAPQYLIRQCEDVTERRHLRERLAHAAIHDPLTDLPNRVLFMDRLDLALKRAKRAGSHVAVIFLDLDRFKVINDSLGHDVGDQVLKGVSRRLLSAVRATDTLARFGGDEFTVLCEDIHDAFGVLELAERIQSSLAQPIALGDGETFMSASIGAALSNDGDTGAMLLRNADVAMYRAKEFGPGRIRMFTDDDPARANLRLRMSADLHRAVERREFELHFQPFVHLSTMRVVASEALIRWRHPTRGVILPGEFVGLAEDTGLIGAIGRWVLEEACREVSSWHERTTFGCNEGWKHNISVNVSPRQLCEPRFATQLKEIIEDTGIDPETLWLEITESTLLQDPERAGRTLWAVRDLGAHFAIDDFGTGYSSLSYLKQLPVESLKIDRTFVEGLGRDSESSAIVRAVVALAESMGLLCIAEGVERPEQAQSLRELGCHIAQGYLFGRPRPASEFGSGPLDDPRCWSEELSATA